MDAVLAKCQEFRRATFLVVLDRANKDDTLDRMREHAKTTPGLTVFWAPANRGPNRPAGLPPHRVKLNQRQCSTIKSEK